MSNFKNTLFTQFAIIVFIIIAIFEGALLFFLISSFKSQLKDKLSIIATEVAIKKDITKNTLSEIQHKYKVYPLFLEIKEKKEPIINNKEYKEGFIIKKIKLPSGEDKLLIYNYYTKDKIIRVSTMICTNKDNIEIITNISLSMALFIYLIALLIGYKFIDEIATNIEDSIKRLKIFNSNVSHELKTPLTIMKGEIEVALMNNECNQELLKSLLSEINYINEITDKLLFLTKKNALNKNNFEDIDLEDIILEMFEKYSKKIKIDLNIKEDEHIIKGDKTLLKIALSNIIENSIKYKATELKITLKKEKNKIILVIKDNGIGIPKEKLPFVFDEFYRVDESRNKKIKGFGLGLSIVKSIINLHNGDIKLKSENKGVEVIITF